MKKIEEVIEKENISCNGEHAQYVPDNEKTIKTCYYPLEKLRDKKCEYLGKIVFIENSVKKECLYNIVRKEKKCIKINLIDKVSKNNLNIKMLKNKEN